MTTDEKKQLEFAISSAFSPAAPITEDVLFAGRLSQLRRVIDAINQRGQHCIVFGERGVGKTSLANIVESRLISGGPVLSVKVNCDATDTYDAVWRKVFREFSVKMPEAVTVTGFGSEGSSEAAAVVDLASTMPDEIKPEAVRRTLERIGQQCLLVVTLDELDRLPGSNLRIVLADTIKMLSDHVTPVTLVLVGVSDSVVELIGEHPSIERALIQIRMPRMSMDETRELLQKGMDRCGMAMDQYALDLVCDLSQGLPHYSHSLGQKAARCAVDDGEKHVAGVHVDAAIEIAIDDAQQTLKDAYFKATTSAHQTLHECVLWACALSRCDELGFFRPGDLCTPMRQVTGKDYQTSSFTKHLNEFCESERGSVLLRAGEQRKYRYRFRNPLLQPYVMMKGMRAGVLKRSWVSGRQR